MPSFLIPETIVREGGKGPEMAVPAHGRTLLITLGINRVIEQESLDVLICGSTDGANWDPKPVLRFPQKFYCGVYSMVLDLSGSPEIRYVRAEYKVNRWGRGEPQPLFGFFVFAEEMAEKGALAQAVA
jgi:hypothetical protein